MTEVEVIKIATLHLEGEAHDWWFHGLTTMGHVGVTTNEDFTRRVLERFERRDPKEHFGELIRLKHTGSVEAYISEFLRLSGMVPDLSEAKRVFMFLEGLEELLRGLVRSNKPTILQDTVGRAWNLQDQNADTAQTSVPAEGERH